MKALHLVVGFCVTAAALAGPAAATPAIGVDVDTLSKSTVDGTDYLVTRVTVDPGGETGWHYHPGDVFGYVREGTMTHYDGGCAVDSVWDAGAPVKEGAGPGFVHNGRNLGSTPLVLEVVYINPTGAPLSVEVPAPADCPVP